MRNYLLVFAVLLFIVLVGPLILFFNLNRTVFSARFIKTEFAKTNLYEKILNADPEEIIKMISKGDGGSEAAEGLSPQDFKKILSSITADELERTFEYNLDQAVNALTRDGRNEFTLDVSTLKSSVLSRSNDQVTLGVVSFAKDSYVLPFPKPIVKYRDQFLRLPLYFAIYALIVALLFISSVLLAKGIRTKFRVMSLLLLVSGIACAIPYATGRILLAMPLSLSLPDALDQIVNDLIIAIRDDILKLFLYECVGFIILAVIFFAVGFVFKKPISAKTQALQPNPAPQS